MIDSRILLLLASSTLAVVIVAMPALAIAAARKHATTAPQGEAGK